MRGEGDDTDVGTAERGIGPDTPPAAGTGDPRMGLSLDFKLVLPPAERRLDDVGGAGMDPRPAATGSSLEAVVAATDEGMSFREPARGRGIIGLDEEEELVVVETPLPLLALALRGVGRMGLGARGAVDTGGKLPQGGREARRSK